MKIEQFFKLNIDDKILDLSARELRDIATMKVNPIFIVEIKEHKFSLSEREYNSLKTHASALIPKLTIVSKSQRSRSSRRLSKEYIQLVHDAVTEDWQPIIKIAEESGKSYKIVSSILKNLYEDGKIVRRKTPGQGLTLQYKLKTRTYSPEHGEIEPIALFDEPFDDSALQNDKLARRAAQREH